MRFPMPNFPCEFEIPDDWIAEAGFMGFRPTTEAYRSTPNSVLIPLTHIEPLVRFVAHPFDFRGFDRARLVRILRGIVVGDVIEPAPAIELPVREFCAGSFRYRVCNGVHRYHASIAAGFSMLPVDL